jgi:hypothetical protein
MEVKLRDFESMNLFSNKNLEKVVASVVNKSSNAVLINMFEDSLILLDHNTGQFYAADYKFDPKKLTLQIDNFEPVELIKEQDEFKDRLVEFFDEDEEVSAHDLAETYKDEVLGQERFIDELIHDAMITKDFTNIIDWNQVKLVKEEVEVVDEKFFKAYQKRLENYPLMEVKLFDWETSVNVSLVETETQKIVNTTAVEKANELWKKDDFKAKFSGAAATFIEDVEEGTEELKEVFETYPQIYFLSNADRKALLGKTIITNKELKESMDILLKGIDLLFEKFDLADLKQEYLVDHGACPEEEHEKKGKKKLSKMYAKDTDAENNFEDPEAKGKPSKEEEPEEKEPKEKKEPALELSSEELGKLASEIKKLADKVEDEGLKDKLLSIAEKLHSGKEEGTRPDVVKEAVSILSL